MDYLPQDPNETEIKKIEKNEKKLKDFRQYLVDKGVVMSFVKVLLSLKYSEDKPRNPIKALRDYFGKYTDDKFKEVEALKDEIDMLNQENPKLIEEAIRLEIEVDNAKREKRIQKLFYCYDLDKNGLVGTKQVIDKISGNKKFEVDEKLGVPEFTKLIEIVSENDTDTEKVLMEKLEQSVQGIQCFKDDIENTLYKKLMIKIREMKKSSIVKK